MRTSLRLIALISLVSLASACTFHARGRSTFRVRTPEPVVVTEEPPPLRERVASDARPPKPESGAVWVHGHWVWRGEWVWQKGRWTTPRSGHVWQPPVVLRDEGQVRYCPGYWRPEGEEPPPAYRSPERVRVTTAPQPQRGPERVAARTPADERSAERERDGALGDEGGDERTRPRRPAQRADAPQANRTTAQPAGQRGPEANRTTAQPAGRRGPEADRAGEPDGPSGKQDDGKLHCELRTASAPAGGLITIDGRNWGDSPTVKVGDHIIPVVRKRSYRLQARVPHGFRGGGTVYIELSEDERHKCGRLDIIGTGG